MYSRLQNTRWLSLKTRIVGNRRTCHTNAVKRKINNNLCVEKYYNGFLCTNIEYIPEYNMTAYLLEHEKTKTEYLHLERDDTNNVFSVGFRTTPLDSMGTPHILEHTVLCGSEKYPVRDPFFKMLNRSLATFMNALTGPDYTFYPFSSQNEADFRNLQKVYCDAAFKPNLLRQDFLQEGWRLEHTQLEDKSSPLGFKGVVYNEMKGAFSETSSLFGQKFINSILPSGTYGHVSGGDPLKIPELTHEHLKNFHARYYHPSNSRIYSYGSFPLEASLKFLNDNYFSLYEYLDPAVTTVEAQPRWEAPRKAVIPCRIDQYGGPVEKQNQIAIGYIMSDITDIYETFMLTALSELMIIGPNSAFYKSLIEKNISGGYNSLTGYDNQIRDTIFAIGLRDIEKSNFSLVEKITDETLQDIYDKGFEMDHIQSVLHGFELAIKHQSPKFGLNVLFNLMPLWNHNGPIIEAMKVNNLLAKLKEDLVQKEYVRDVIGKYFLNNNHKLVMTMEPDSKFDEKLNEAEKNLLESKVNELTDKDRELIYNDGIQLSLAQKEVQNLDVLPCLKLEEIVLNKTAPSIKHTASASVPLQLCEANTNGVTYFKGVLGTETLNVKQRILLPFFNYILDKFDTNKFSYRDFDKHITKSSSGLSVASHITEHIGLPGQYEEGVLLSSHCLDEKLTTMLDIWKEIFNKPDFSNTDRFAMLMNSYCSNLTGGIIQNGHTYAMQAARSLISSVEESKERTQGIHHVMIMQELQKEYSTEELQTIADEIGNSILNGDNLRAAFHFSNTNADIEKAINDFCTSICSETEEVHGINWTDCKDMEKKSRGLHISMNIPVNFCSKVIPTVPYTDPDYAKLRVLSRFLTSKYLHPIVREQNGAYGGGAAMTLDGSFNFYSYRDPNSRVTLDAFDGSADWIDKNSNLIDDQNLFEAKLSILQQMDQPITEYMKGIDLFLFGLSYDIWQTQRERVLAVNAEDLIEVSKKYLDNENWCGRCVIGDGASQKIEKDGEEWEVISGPRQDEASDGQAAV